MIQPVLPLWDKVIFVDWHGVLSRDPFWMSILNSPRHPLHRQLTESVEYLFGQNETLVRDWMRGDVKANDVIESMGIVLDKRYNSDYLSRRLVEDCRLMQTNGRLFQILQGAQNNGALIVLATDNMDCFYEFIRRVQSNRHKPVSNSENETQPITETVRLLYDILCSSERGILKNEDPLRFYGDWLSNHSLEFRNALLLDDLEKNCTAFRSVGGVALQISIKSLEKDPDHIQSEILSWLQTKS